MKQKGFTLIELLAVIVILAIIAVITTPKITNEIEQSRKNLAKNSALKYKNTIDEYVLRQEMNKNEITLNGTYNINENGYIYNEETTYEILFSGEKPSGYLTYSNNELTKAHIQINTYCIEFENNEIKSIQKQQCSNT